MSPQTESDAPLAHLRSLPFVRGLRFRPATKGADWEDDGILEIVTPQGTYRLSIEVKRSYLGRSMVNAVIGRALGRPQSDSHKRSKKPSGKLVLARYVPAIAGEQFVEAGICFADDLGNIHLRLGSEYNWTALGKREPAKLPDADRTTPAAIQLLFQIAVHPESAQWTVRDLARAAGIGKTKAAQLRGQFLRERILTGQADKPEFRITPEISNRLVTGYCQILRPRLLLRRCRYPDQSVDQFVSRLSDEARAQKIPYALTGGPAADAMQHFYRSPEVSVFLDAPDSGRQRSLRLLPDRSGPVVVLKPFGDLVYWREFDGKMVAPPWLIYAELLTSSEPRAREAAEEFRREFLQ
jgi:Transcriptional regulator, AbiEi antitoxin, Type IV TA system